MPDDFPAKVACFRVNGFRGRSFRKSRRQLCFVKTCQDLIVGPVFGSNLFGCDPVGCDSYAQCVAQVCWAEQL